MSVGPTSSSAPPSNIAGTLGLAIVAIGLTVAAYVAQRLPSRSDGGYGGRGKGSRRGLGANSGESAGGAAAAESGNKTISDLGGARRDHERGYYALCAEQHVRRQGTNMMEWADECLGVAFSFSPILFSIRAEERQAPLVLLTLNYLRQEEHHVSITIEETFVAETAEEYREASLLKIADCSKILSVSSVRIGSTQRPQAEYCYADERDLLTYVLSIFVTYERLAITVQYVARSRVQNILPTAFYELIRSIRFAPPRPSPSYLCISEPRLGLGFRLPLDFAVSETLEGLGDADGPLADAANTYGCVFATMAGRGDRQMGVLACYEPPLSTYSGGPGSAGAASPLATTTRGGRYTATSWQQYLERQVQTAMQRLGVRTAGRLQLAFKVDATQGGAADPVGALVLRPLNLTVPTHGNFGDEDDEDTNALNLVGSFCLMEENLDASSPYTMFFKDRDVGLQSNTRAYISIFFIPIREECVSFCFVAAVARHTVEEFVSFCTSTVQSVSVGNHYGQTLSVLYCNPRHKVVPFRIALSVADGQVVEEPMLGDPLVVVHSYGVEHTAVTVRVFPLLQLLAAGPRGGHTSGTATPAGRPPRVGRHSTARVLEHMLRGYLAQLPGGAIIHVWETVMLNSMVALKTCFELPATTGGHVPSPSNAVEHSILAGGVHVDDMDSASIATTEWLSSRALALEEEVGDSNPFARFYAPPPPPDTYFGLKSLTHFPEHGSSTNKRATSINALQPSTSIPAASPQSPPPQPPPRPSGTAPCLYARSTSSRSQDDAEEPLRVAVAVVRDGFAFLFSASASVYSYSTTQQVVVDLASQLGGLATA